jgi:hypothetical protein
VCKSQTNFAQRFVEREGEMAQGRKRQPFEMPFTFSLNNISSIVVDHLNKKHFCGSTQLTERRNSKRRRSTDLGISRAREGLMIFNTQHVVGQSFFAGCGA